MYIHALLLKAVSVNTTNILLAKEIYCRCSSENSFHNGFLRGTHLCTIWLPYAQFKDEVVDNVLFQCTYINVPDIWGSYCVVTLNTCSVPVYYALLCAHI